MSNNFHKVLYVSRSEFPDRQTGKLVQNLKVQYLSQSTVEDENNKGLPALTSPCDFELFKKFSKVPANYQLDFTSKPDAKGRPQLHIVGVSLSSNQDSPQ